MLDQPPGCLMTLTHQKVKIVLFGTSNGFHQIISEPTHIQRNNSSCIDLTFTDQPSLVTNNGVHASLQSSCHHRVTHHTFNLNVVYPILINAYFGTTKRLIYQTYKK